MPWLNAPRILTAAAVILLASAVAVAVAQPGTASAAPIVHVWLTTPDLSSHLTQQPDVTLGAAGAATLTFTDATRLQSIDGFGAAFTDTSAALLQNSLSPAARAQVLSDLFARPTGIGLSFMRVPMGSSDFTACGCAYSYDDGAADPTLSRFSTAHDDAAVIPVIKQAQADNPAMKLFANPWSPPAWMKTNNTMLGTDATGAVSTLNSADYDPLAQYFVHFLKDYASKGVQVWGITPQNEPDIAPGTYSGMLLPAGNEATFVAQNLAPALTAAGLGSVKILGGDATGAKNDYATTLYGNSATANALYGTAWHCYGGLGDMTVIHNAHPTKPVYTTECSTGPTGIAGNTAEQTLISTNNWAAGVDLWNLALDPSGGPKMGHGCDGCTGLVTIDPATGRYTYPINYYELGQFSMFLAPGAQRVPYTDGNGIWAQAYRNSDGTDVLVAHNTNTGATGFTVNWNGAGNFSYTLPAGATVTFTDSTAGTAASAIVGQGSGRCLDDTGNPAGGVQPWIWDCAAGNANQRYSYTPAKQLTIAGQCLGADNNGTTNGTRVIIWPCNGTPSQRWTITPDGAITNDLSGLCLDVTGTATANRSLVQLWTCAGTTNQLWGRR